MKKETILIHSGRAPEQHSGSVNPPIYQASTIVFPTLEAYVNAEQGKGYYDDIGSNRRIDFSYGISGTPTTFALQESLTTLEGGDCAWLLPSGLSAITTALLSFVKQGDHILVTDSVYSPTRRFCNKVLKKLGVETEYYDPLIGEGIAEHIRDNTAVIFLESPGSQTFEVQDVPAIVKVAQEKGIVTIIDNAWATPLHFQPLEHGVDVSIQVPTKYINGGSDVLLGAIICKEVHRKKINECFRNLGISVSPFACYLAHRGLRSLAARLRQHQESALKICDWLQSHDKVTQVLYPALPEHPTHELWKRDFTGANGLITFILDKHYSLEELGNFINTLEYFGIGASWGGYESLILPQNLDQVRTATTPAFEGSIIRIHVGLEHVDDLIADLDQGLQNL